MYKDLMTINKLGIMEIEGISVKELEKQYQTPLFVYNQNILENKMKLFKDNFTSRFFKTEVLYASKAFCCQAIYNLAEKMGLGVDVVTGGEIHTALSAGFNPENMYFHGNNKSTEELVIAINRKIGCIVVDNDCEIKLISEILKDTNVRQKIMIRVNPGIEAHTHEYIKTARLESKFGYSTYNPDKIIELINSIESNPYLDFKGFHCHIGSQIQDPQAFYNTAKEMINFLKILKNKYNRKTDWLNIGGGFGVTINEEDEAMDYKLLLKTLVKVIEDALIANKMSLEKVIIEPGRSIVSEAAITLYRIGGIKETHAGKNYLFVDGGMTDNLRPALYQAKYEADIATKMNLPKNDKRTIAGKLCESGDILIRDYQIQKAEIGDLLAIYSTGAYCYSMASNYNRTLRPAVVFVKNGKHKLVIKRESYEDLIKNELKGVL
ncbi:MAG: diaminopimelate decarboxylase [Erysipelotrichales bacterium]|nr:diaminopimelate decarboxylase [Erysipelotrichales bacterium]